MNISGATVLITGANRGLGREFARQALARGAAKVYATARRPGSVDLPGVETIGLDITDPDSVDAAAALAADVDLLINNAGVATRQDLVTGEWASVRAEMETHFFGTLAMVRAFAPILAANGGGAILNVNSALAFAPYVGANAYAAGKSAQWALTNAVRLELAAQGTQVTGVHLAATDTDMMAGYDVPKNDPADVVRATFDGLAAGAQEILVDADTVAARSRLAEAPGLFSAA